MKTKPFFTTGFLILFFLSSCHREATVAVYDTEPLHDKYNKSHPLADSIQVIIDNYVKKGMPGISVAIHTEADGLWLGTSGVAQIENNIPLTVNHSFHSASVAKTYMVTTAMTLVEEGILDLDKTISTYLPVEKYGTIPNYNSATIRNLIGHTSGIPDIIDNAKHITDYFNNLMADFDTEYYLDNIRKKKADFEPNERVSYSNTNTVLLALVMDEASGRKHEDLVSERIINKLNLKNTFYKNEEGYPAPKTLVNTYLDIKGNGELQNISKVQRNFDVISIAHDAMMASPHDYLQFIHALFNGKLISESSLAEMKKYTPFTVNEEGKKKHKVDYIGEAGGLASMRLTTGEVRFGHDGGSLGGANCVWYYPNHKAAIVISSNFGGFIGSANSDLLYNYVIGFEGTLFGELEQVVLGLEKKEKVEN